MCHTQIACEYSKGREKKKNINKNHIWICLLDTNSKHKWMDLGCVYFIKRFRRSNLIRRFRICTYQNQFRAANFKSTDSPNASNAMSHRFARKINRKRNGMQNNNDNGKLACSIYAHSLFKLNDAAFICLSEIEHTKCKAIRIKTYNWTAETCT